MFGRAYGFIRLLRPVNCFMVGLAVWVGEIVAYGKFYLYQSLLGFLTAFTLTGASMIANDYWDRDADAINSPNRPIVSGLISINAALLYLLILVAIGLFSALLTNANCLLIALTSLSVSILYSYRGKKLGILGNLMVGLCIAIPLFYGGFVYSDLSSIGLRALSLFDLLVFLAITGREVNKGIADVEGDKTRGERTVAILFGLKTAAVVATTFYLSAVALSTFPLFLGLVSWIYLPFVSVTDIGFIASSLMLLRDPTKKNAEKVKNMVLIWMNFGLLAFLGGVLW